MSDNAAKPAKTTGKIVLSREETVRRPLILIADDDEEIVEILSTLLEARGYKVLRAMSGYDALGLVLGAFRGEVDAVISDVHMPNGSGLNLLEALRKMDQSVPVFLMTGDPNFDHRKAKAAGANGIVMKPLDTKLLVESLQAAMDAQKRVASA